MPEIGGGPAFGRGALIPEGPARLCAGAKTPACRPDSRALPPEARAEVLYRVAYKGYLERDLRR